MTFITSLTLQQVFNDLSYTSPLDALRKQELTAEQLCKLAVVCEYLGRGDLADLVIAEADMRVMLEQKGLSVRWLN